MNRNKYDVVIFDLDGTLTDTIDSLTYVCNRVALKYGFGEFTHEEIKSKVGYGIRNLLLSILPEELKEDAGFVEDAYEYMNRIFLSNPCYKVNIYEGIAEVLDLLSQNGIKMAISTNKLQKGADEIASKLLKAWNFTHVIGDDPSHPKKPDPYSIELILKELGISKNRALYVGDSEADIQTAKNAGIDMVSVSWGFRSEQLLRKFAPKHLISRPCELPKLIFS